MTEIGRREHARQDQHRPQIDYTAYEPCQHHERTAERSALAYHANASSCGGVPLSKVAGSDKLSESLRMSLAGMPA